MLKIFPSGDSSPAMNELYLTTSRILSESGDGSCVVSSNEWAGHARLGHVASTINACKEILDLQSELKLSLYFHVLCDDIYFASLMLKNYPACVFYTNNIVLSYSLFSGDFQQLFVRLFLRKHQWLRSIKISYPEISTDINILITDLVNNCGLLWNGKKIIIHN